ncbi:MAG: hypothetical protein KME47_09800 [Nodosilinea sp. WJT8-NPBG4]|jgi:hypothetical protein|nr:hypothetical protein [Nodosilinea sp. WJT8-NPBG4]
MENDKQYTIHDAIDVTTSLSKQAFNAYKQAFFSEAAEQRYDATGKAIGNAAIEAVKLTRTVKSKLNKPQPE